MQLGSSFCLGWFAVSFAGQARAAYESVLFRAVRRDRFAAAIRQYRSNAAQSRPWNPAQPGPGWEKVWGQDRSQAERIGELLVPNEHPIGALHTSEQWAEQRSFWKRKWSCSSREGLLLATDMGVFQVARETYDRPVTWNIGMNVVYAPLQAVRSATIFGRALFGKRLHHVQVTLGIRDVTTCLEVPFDDNDIDAAKDLVQDLTARGSSWSQNQVHAESMNLTPSAQESRS